MFIRGPRMKASEIIDGIGNLRILVIGDLMLDHYVCGDVHRVSPEAPVPVILMKSESYRAGGAGNVAANLASLGAAVTVMGVAGEDEFAMRLLDMLEQAEIRTDSVVRSSDVSTIVKTRVVARGQQVCRIDREGPRAGYVIDIAKMRFCELLESKIAGSDCVILSDYAKGVISQAMIDLVVRIAGARDIMVSADPKPSHSLLYRGMKLLTPNRQEALQMAGLEAPSSGELYPLEEVFGRIHDRHGPELLAVTLGAEGMALGSGGRVETVLPADVREVFDISGAGDTVIAAMTAALASGASPPEAALLANKAAGLVVSQFGTVPVDRTALAAQV